MSQLTLTDYQAKTESTAVYPGQGSIAGLSYTVLGLTNEAGEVAGKLKKVMRDDAFNLTNEKRLAMADELGDVLWYLARTADELGLNLGLIAENNLKKLDDRRLRNVLGGSGDNR